MKNKQKGTRIENELFDLLNKFGFKAIRCAGSGTKEFADCDIVAGNKKIKYAIEVKSSKKPYKYISKEQMKKFKEFSKIFDLKPLIALRFNYNPFYFVKPSDFDKKKNSFGINLKQAKKYHKKLQI